MRTITPVHLAAAVAAAALVAPAAATAVPAGPDPAGRPGFPPPPAAAEAAVALAPVVPPANDELANAELVTATPFTSAVSTLEATTAPDDPNCHDGTATVWYAYTPPVSTTIAADTFGSDFDTVLSVYTGAPGSLLQLACNDDAGAGLQSQVIVPVTAGQTYYFMAAGLGTAGSLVFNVDASRFPLVGVRTTRAQEARPSADADHLAWTQVARRAATLFLKPRGEPRKRVNRPRTNGYSGGFEGGTFVYQETRGRRSDLQLYDLATGGRSAPPAGVNTRNWEWHPTISGDWLLFARAHLSGRADLVVLRNLVTGETRVLDRLRWRRGTVAEAGQVNGNYAVWFRCTPACDVFRHDIAAGTTTRIGNPGRRQQYDPSVTSDGTVYFVQSGRGCGTSVRLVRQPLAGPRRALASLGGGRDSAHTYALENANGTTTVFFDRVRCSTGAWDVLKVIDP